MTTILSGWFFDVYANENDVSVWIIDNKGAAHHLRDKRLRPSFFVGGTAEELRAVREWLERASLTIQLQITQCYELAARKEIPVLQVQVQVPSHYERVVRRGSDTFPDLEYYNADLTIPQLFFFENNAFPLARCYVAVNDDNEIPKIKVVDSPWNIHYALPPLRVITMRLEGEMRDPNHGYRAPLEISYEERTYTLAFDNSKLFIETVREHLKRHDPDLLITDWGDSFILPQLQDLARTHGIELPFNRDVEQTTRTRREQSYWSYGRVMFKSASQTFFGRWHIDRQNAFLSHDYGLEGIFEIARLSQRPVQDTARTSTGSAISAMQVSTAYRRDYLIPWRKRQPETFKTALDLLQSDQGGLTYQPIKGLHFEVGELDFVSMYPAIMVAYNISYETVHCDCCPDSRVPQIGYSMCKKRRGLIPLTLELLVQKKIALQKAKRNAKTDAEREHYRRLISAIKWILVTCFGYLGYRNARFGRIEAHEAVTAYGREVLLLAKEIAQRFGFRVLHMLTDSLWVHKVYPERSEGTGATEEEYEKLVEEIERVTGLPLGMEGIYKWVAFLPSRVDERRSVPDRYFGALQNGELKLRGIELRRRDTPQWIRNVQQELLNELAATAARADVATALPRLFDIVVRELDRLRAGQVPLRELVLTYHLSRDPDEYKSETLNAVVARQLQECGVELHAGESLHYVITDYKADLGYDRARAWELSGDSTGYDVERYTELLLRAVETVLAPFGVNAKMLHDHLTRALPLPVMQKQIATKATTYWGPLFEGVKI
jgi:DNA polymerase-2